jgi:ACS family allantoate permease-like MFS transporter
LLGHAINQAGKMSAMEKTHDTSSDPEKVAELGRKTTYGEGEAKDTMFIHADPNDGDEALKAFAGHEGEVIVMTPEAEKKLLRKIDLNLMPVRSPPKKLHPS